MPPRTDFSKLLRVLLDGAVEFILVGGVAGSLHGAARATYDVDVVYRRSPENLSRLVAALAPYGPYLRGAPAGLPFFFDVQTLGQGLNFTLTTSVGDLDLLGEVTGGGRGPARAQPVDPVARYDVPVRHPRRPHPAQANGWQTQGPGGHRRTRGPSG